jgi:hypothetical protein
MMIGKELKQAILPRLRVVFDAISAYRIVASLATAAYCAVHLFAGHRFSLVAFVSALVFGAAVALGTAVVSCRWTSSPPA